MWDRAIWGSTMVGWSPIGFLVSGYLKKSSGMSVCVCVHVPVTGFGEGETAALRAGVAPSSQSPVSPSLR